MQKWEALAGKAKVLSACKHLSVSTVKLLASVISGVNLSSNMIQQ